MLVLPITLTIAGAAALVNIWIAYRVGQMRGLHKVSIGDGGAQPLIARMRAHSNFVEYTPFFLILLGLVEMARGSPAWLWAVGIVFLLARIAHVFGMDRPPGNRVRTLGMMVSAFVLLGLAIYAITIPYLERVRPESITYAIRHGDVRSAETG
ncbi:MAG: putative relative of glutathione S-transferase superfamily-like protein [Alphaproteobacteria bacterium]|nr:putative relative of glutathione S-transferase superfamily-like protein [Alphaproteobacteria bacterium]MDB5723086.1 putative relative of glutathione S-transferase superfamily-like protein [Alphaproteobacteria bacterium]